MSLIHHNELYTLERAEDGFVLTILATGETIRLSSQSIYSLNEFLMEAIESLEGHENDTSRD